ncbi:MAG: nuclear transport factor 2 family protein [Chloroherpetonaceae bacterium]|nr:nuclear transport factor 2 family protein [Chthonomonadaceae bacterium]MDW8206530.1 nuclear transport factor 2 family protein [Chloroherpetonaceae bacterium]
MTPLEIVKTATAAFNAGDVEGALAYYADDVIQRLPAIGDEAGFIVRHGKDALRRIFQSNVADRMQFQEENYVACGDMVAVEGIVHSIVDGREVAQPTAIFYELRQNRIVKLSLYFNRVVLNKPDSTLPFTHERAPE